MINYDLNKIKVVIFDVDGVLSSETITIDNTCEPIRTVNVKDGYAIQLACKRGLKLVIMTGGDSEAIHSRYTRLGISDIHMSCALKLDTYNVLKNKYGFEDDEVAYVGDDIPDYEVMQAVGCPCCPSDACDEIKSISIYVSDKKGGHGCGRDILEQVLKAQSKWTGDKAAFGW